MPSTYQVPGVYRQDVFIAPARALPTGVPGFVGFADPTAGVPAVQAFNIPVALHRIASFNERFIPNPLGYLGDAVAGFFANGGVSCYVVAADASAKGRAGALEAALDSLAPVVDLDLIIIPDAMMLAVPGNLALNAGVICLQRHALAHCAQHGGRFAILDPLPGLTTVQVLGQRTALVGSGSEPVTEPVNGALYYPWIVTSGGRTVPAGGHVAGVVARTDAKTGVFKAPANEALSGVLDLDVQVDDAAQSQLNPEGVNCIRAFPGRGIRVWGARTLSRDPAWAYVNVRRLVLTIRRWIEENMGWATFEPSTAGLWAEIDRELRVYLYDLWKAGALRGASAGEAFYVHCNAETNPPEAAALGQIVTEIGVATSLPAEYVVMRVVHREASAAVA
jgi:hypothetical protein